jgi:hypothetical protein
MEKKHGTRYGYIIEVDLGLGARARTDLGVWSENTTRREPTIQHHSHGRLKNTSTVSLITLHNSQHGDNISKHHDTQYRTVSPHTRSRPAEKSRPGIKPRGHCPARRINATCTYCRSLLTLMFSLEPPNTC